MNFSSESSHFMAWSDFARARAACAYFFICPGLVYGIFTSRMPAFKLQTGATDGEVGLILLCVGVSSFATLLLSGRLMRRFGSRAAAAFATIAMPISLMAAGFAASPWMLGVCCALMGLSMGICDVAMNAEGILVERRYKRPVMSSMHGAYSVGGVAGAVSGSIFAALGFGPEINAVMMLALYLAFRRPAMKNLPDPGEVHEAAAESDPQKDAAEARKARKAQKAGRLQSALPGFIVLCGVLSACAYAAEGAVAEWGGLLLHDEKGASEGLAALVYAVFCTVTAVCRLGGDAMRTKFGDFALLLLGAVLAVFAMSGVLLAPTPELSLACYAMMGVGLALPAPILFSQAGAYPGIDPVRASSVVAIFSYSGLLFMPPFLGFAAERWSIAQAQTAVIALCVIVAAGAVALMRMAPSRRTSGRAAS